MIMKATLLVTMLATPFALHAAEKQDIQQLKEEAAKSIAGQLQHTDFSAATSRLLARQAASGGEISIPLHDLLASAGTESSSLLGDVDRKITEAKGLAGLSQGVLQLRLYLPKHAAGQVPSQLKDILVAVEPMSGGRQQASLPAFDAKGKRHNLDPKTPPTNPVLIVDVNGREATRAGALLINNELRRAKMQSLDESGSQDGAEFTVLTKIRLNDRLDDWSGGAAEVFAIVSGLQPDQAKAQIELVDMSYLDWERTDYTPFQDMIAWKDYGLGAANVQLFEQDDDTSYSDLAASIVASVNKQLPVVSQSMSSLSKIGLAVINSIDNGNDYVDSFYLIEQNKNYDRLRGAANNATASFCFHVVGTDRCRR